MRTLYLFYWLNLPSSSILPSEVAYNSLSRFSIRAHLGASIECRNMVIAPDGA